MRELDFSESNLRNRWFGVKNIWKELQGEVKRYIKFRLERALVLERRVGVGCGRYKRRGYRNGRYVRDLPRQRRDFAMLAMTFYLMRLY